MSTLWIMGDTVEDMDIEIEIEDDKNGLCRN